MTSKCFATRNELQQEYFFHLRRLQWKCKYYRLRAASFCLLVLCQYASSGMDRCLYSSFKCQAPFPIKASFNSVSCLITTFSRIVTRSYGPILFIPFLFLMSALMTEFMHSFALCVYGLGAYPRPHFDITLADIQFFINRDLCSTK